MDKRLLGQAIAKFVSGFVLVGLLLFVPAGTLNFPRAWILMGILFVPMFAAGLVMVKKSPELLRKRLNVKEQESEQKSVILASGLMFIASFVIAGLNERFGWIRMPMWVSVIFAGVFLAGYALFAEVLRENAFLSRTVEVQKDQIVVDTGLYGIVRHPMYMSTLLMFLSMPLVLGSPISFLVSLLYIPIISRRIRNEEAVLEEGLKGYSEYKKKVKFKVIPYVW